MLLQVAVLVLQDRTRPDFFLPRRLARAQTYDYHPPLPLAPPGDAEAAAGTGAAAASLGDCAICMDAIVVADARRRDADGGEKRGGLLGAVGAGVGAGRKSYSLAPCHHLFVSARARACVRVWGC